MKFITTVMLAAWLAGAAAAADLAGSYRGHGINPGRGGSYDCEVAIKQNGEVFAVKWFFDGKLGYEGVGIIKNGLFCVGYAAPNAYGVVVYEIKTDGTLEGVWTAPGFTELGTETLKRK